MSQLKFTLFFAIVLILAMPAVLSPMLTQDGSASFADDSNATYIIFDGPIGTIPYPGAINNRGVVAGSVVDQSGMAHGFVRDTDGTITVFDAPNANGTNVAAINEQGDIVGSIGNSIGFGSNSHAFLRDRDGNFAVFDPPNSNFSLASAINNKGDVVGWFGDTETFTVRGFIRDKYGNFTIFDAESDAHSTAPSSINDSGDVTGILLSFRSSFFDQSFIRKKDGSVVVLVPPDEEPGSLIEAHSINNDGEVTGSTGLPHGALHRLHGFVRDARGNFTIFDPPNSSTTFAWAINDAGQVAGQSEIPFVSGPGAFIRNRQGQIVLFEVPGGAGTRPNAINSHGDVTGFFMI